MAYLIVPVFALANAGVGLGGSLGGALTNPVFLGIVAGLALGKPLGITLFAWLAVRLGIADLPHGVTWRQLFAASWLAGIGFTMSLFVAGLSFSSADIMNYTKLGILLGSILSAVAGLVFLGYTCSLHSRREKAAAAQPT